MKFQALKAVYEAINYAGRKCECGMACASLPRASKKKIMKSLIISVAVGSLLAMSSAAQAAKYMSLGQAVKTFIAKDNKVVKTTKRLTAAQKKRLEADYGWKAKKDTYTFYMGKKGDAVQSYVFVVPEIFNTCFHKYAVGMNQDGQVIETVVVELSCPRAFPINKKSFLSQFKEKRHVHALTTRGGAADIDAVTGATLSSEATATAARKAVSLHNLLFGKAEAIVVSEAVKKARDEGNVMIEEAIETGETIDGPAQLPEKKSDNK